MATLYIDTNVLLNVVNGETNPYGKDLALPAARLFHQAISCRHQVIISSWTSVELMKKVKPGQVTMILEMIKKKLIVVRYDDKDVEAAKAKSPDNFPDALHVVLAEKSKADFIITRNVDDFMKIGTDVPVKKPEHLL